MARPDGVELSASRNRRSMRKRRVSASSSATYLIIQASLNETAPRLSQSRCAIIISMASGTSPSRLESVSINEVCREGALWYVLIVAQA
jgi:hypothetical protein